MNSSNTWWVNMNAKLRTVLLLILFLLIEQGSFASLQSVFLSAGNNSGFLHYAEKHPIPLGNPAVLDVVVEEVEEDEVQDQDYPSYGSLRSQYAIGKRVHCCSINRIYRYLAFAIHSQVTHPLFLLHHSWKLDFC